MWRPYLTSRPFSTRSEEREFVVDSGASMQTLSNKDLSSVELETLWKSRNSTTIVTVNGQVQSSGEAQIYVHDLDLFVTLQWLDETLAVLSICELWEEHDNMNEWVSDQKMYLTTNGKKGFHGRRQISCLLMFPDLRQAPRQVSLLHVSAGLIENIFMISKFTKWRN